MRPELRAAGLALVVVHLLDLAFSGPATHWAAVLAIVAVPAAWAVLAPGAPRSARFVLDGGFGLLAIGWGVVSHVLHVVNTGPDVRDLTGLAFVAGGALLLWSAVSALRAERVPGRHLGWLMATPLLVLLGLFPLYQVFEITHAPRVGVASLGIPHEDLRLKTSDGRSLAAWYVPSRNRAALLVVHGSGGNRGRAAGHVRMLAEHGYGVLAVDMPGHGESAGHGNGLGDNAQPAVDAALRWLRSRDDVDPRRVGGLGLSMGGEILLESAARTPALHAVVSDGSTRPEDAIEIEDPAAVDRALGAYALALARGLAGMEPAPDLLGVMPDLAGRPVLLIAGARVGQEVRANERYRELAGAELWSVPGAGHTGGLRVRPADYERRVIRFLDRTLEVSR